MNAPKIPRKMHVKAEKKWYFVSKIVQTYCEKKSISDREKLLEFEAEGQEFFLTVSRNNFGNKIPFLSSLNFNENLAVLM